MFFKTVLLILALGGSRAQQPFRSPMTNDYMRMKTLKMCDNLIKDASTRMVQADLYMQFYKKRDQFAITKLLADINLRFSKMLKLYQDSSSSEFLRTVTSKTVDQLLGRMMTMQSEYNQIMNMAGIINKMVVHLQTEKRKESMNEGFDSRRRRPRPRPLPAADYTADYFGHLIRKADLRKKDFIHEIVKQPLLKY